MSQSHFTLAFPLKAPADTQALTDQLTAQMPALIKTADSIGTIHYARFTILSQRTALFLGDFDGEFGDLMTELGKQAGPVFDTIFQHVDGPPPMPVAGHVEEFVEWSANHLLRPALAYSAYPDVTAKEIKALAAATDISGLGELNPFLVILPLKSRLAFIEVELLLRARTRGTQRTWIRWAPPISLSSCRLRTTRSDSSRFTMARSTNTLPTSPRTSARFST